MTEYLCVTGTIRAPALFPEGHQTGPYTSQVKSSQVAFNEKNHVNRTALQCGEKHT